MKSETLMDYVADLGGMRIEEGVRLFDSSHEAVERMFQRLVEAKELVGFYLAKRFKYWRLSRAEAKRRELSFRRSTGPLGQAGVLDLVGRIHAGWLPGIKRRYSPAEFAAAFPGLVGPAAPAVNYVLDGSDEVARLAFVVVDHGQPVRRLVAKLHRLADRRRRLAEFDELIKAACPSCTTTLREGRPRVTTATPRPSAEPPECCSPVQSG